MKTSADIQENSVVPEVKTSVCLNCGAEVSSHFCADCGQRYPQHRLTMRELLHLSWGSLVDFDRGFLFTVKELFKHPSAVISDYINGRRVVYTNPVKYLFLWLGISTFIGFSLVDIDVLSQRMSQQQFKKSSVQTEIKSEKAKQRLEQSRKTTLQMQRLMIQNPQFTYAILIPIAGMFTYLFFKKQGYTYAEHLLLNAYITTQTIILNLPVYVLYWLFPTHFGAISITSLLIVALCYTAIAASFFYKSSYLKAGAKALVAHVLAYFVFGILLIVLMIAYIIFLLPK